MKRSFVIAAPETGQERSSTTFLSPLCCPIASVNQTNLPFEEKGKGEGRESPIFPILPSLQKRAMMMTHSLDSNFSPDTMQSCSFTEQWLPHMFARCVCPFSRNFTQKAPLRGGRLVGSLFADALTS